MAQGTAITIIMGNEVLDKLKRLASKEQHKKGFLGRTITEATEKYLEEKEQNEIAKRQIELMEKGFHMGKILIKNRSELYDRW